MIREGVAATDPFPATEKDIRAVMAERDAYRSALQRILNRYHDRPLIGIDPKLPFHLKEIALKALFDGGFEEEPTDGS